jgi:hypothetical protein
VNRMSDPHDNGRFFRISSRQWVVFHQRDFQPLRTPCTTKKKKRREAKRQGLLVFDRREIKRRGKLVIEYLSMLGFRYHEVDYTSRKARKKPARGMESEALKQIDLSLRCDFQNIATSNVWCLGKNSLERCRKIQYHSTKSHISSLFKRREGCCLWACCC